MSNYEFWYTDFSTTTIAHLLFCPSIVAVLLYGVVIVVVVVVAVAVSSGREVLVPAGSIL